MSNRYFKLIMLYVNFNFLKCKQLLKKKKKPQINHLTLHLKELETEPKVSKREIRVDL